MSRKEKHYRKSCVKATGGAASTAASSAPSAVLGAMDSLEREMRPESVEPLVFINGPVP